MAFQLANFQPIGGQGKRGRAPQRFSYATLDTHATVDTAGYFNAGVAFNGVYNSLEVGDIIDVVVYTSAIGGAISTYGTHVVATKAAGIVDVTNVTVGVVTNTD